MKLVRLSCAMVLAGVISAGQVSADPVTSPAPSKAQLERAKQAFAAGKRLHDAGKLTEAIERFKQSYALSKNPLLLYNIALTMEELGADNLDLAVVFYRRFLAEAPADAPQRAEVGDRIAAITRKLEPAAPEPPPPPPPPIVAAPPVSAPSYGAADFQHQAIESAPPGAPLDLTATTPPDAHFTVVLFFRGADEPGFASTPLRPHGDALVARILAARVAGRSLQYYLEVRDAAGNVVTRAGKPSSPNVVALDASAPPHTLPDVVEGPITPAPPIALGLTGRDHEDPMAHPAELTAVPAGPSPLTIAKWTATGVALAGIATGITFYALAVNHSNALASDATGCGTPPCQRYDSFDRDLQHTGKLDQTIANVTLFSGIAVAAVAGYLWYRDLSERHWAVAPVVGTAAAGATAAVRF
ncbi:MAG TPA: hypothetical protein VGC42_25020 [Kofleriaceae bacterium]